MLFGVFNQPFTKNIFQFLDNSLQEQFKRRCEDLFEFVGNVAKCAISETEWKKLLIELDVQPKLKEEKHEKILQRKGTIEE